MKDYNKVESCLKSFLKNNKRLSYSMALLISFLINGGFSYADEAIQVPLRTEIKTRIEKEQENISQMLKEADESMKDIELKIKKLTQRGEFWVKPLEKSYQGFIFANWGNYSKNKNKTESNFNGPEYSASYGKNMGYGQFSNGKYYGEYGIVKNPLEFVDKIDFGANITPKAVTEKTIVEKTVIQKIIEAPKVTPPTVTIATITPPTVSTPTIGTMSEPGAVTVNVTAPGTPPTLSPITVTPVTALNISPTPPTVGDAPTVTAPTVEAPATPAGFTPRLITPPEAPADITVTPPGEVQANLTGSGANPTTYYYWWNGNGGAISQVSLKAGIFNIKPGNIINVNAYQAQAYPGTTPQGAKPSNGDQIVNQTFFHTLLNVPYSEYSSGVVINNNRPNSTVINLETEGTVAGDLSNRETDGYITSAKKATLKGYQTYSGIKGQDNTELLFINKGTVNLNVANTTYLFTTSHNNGGLRTNYIDNEGTISAKGENSIIIKHSPDTNQAKAWIYSNSGTMKAEGKGSIVYGAAYGYLGNGRAAFINNGIIEVTGESAIGVIFPKDSKNSTMMNGHLVWLKKPISLKGTKSMGFVAQNTNISNEKNLVKFDINATKAIGILQDVENAGTAKTAGKIEIGGNSSESMGIYAKQGTLELIAPHTDSGETESSIELKAGSNNIGIYAKGASTVNFDGITKIIGGEGQKIALATEGSTINLKKSITAGDKATNKFVKDAVPLYSTGAGSKINVAAPDSLRFYLSGNSTGAYAKIEGQ